MKKFDKIIFVFYLSLGISIGVPRVSFSQNSDSTNILIAKRVFVNTKIYRNGIKISDKKVTEMYLEKGMKKPISLINRSKYFIPSGCGLMAGGVYMAYDAIKGTRMEVEIEGKTYVYYKRPIFQVLGGIAVFSLGVSLLEYGNEFREKSVNIYNNSNKKKTSKNEFDLNLGFTSNDRFGLKLEF